MLLFYFLGLFIGTSHCHAPLGEEEGFVGFGPTIEEVTVTTPPPQDATPTIDPRSCVTAFQQAKQLKLKVFLVSEDARDDLESVKAQLDDKFSIVATLFQRASGMLDLGFSYEYVDTYVGHLGSITGKVLDEPSVAAQCDGRVLCPSFGAVREAGAPLPGCIELYLEGQGVGVGYTFSAYMNMNLFTMAHEMFHAFFGLTHDNLLSAQANAVLEYGNRFSTMGGNKFRFERAGVSYVPGAPLDFTSNVDRPPLPGFVDLFANGWFDAERFVDVTVAGEVHQLAPFDLLSSREQTAFPMALRISEQTDGDTMPPYLIVVSYRALADTHTFTEQRNIGGGPGVRRWSGPLVNRPPAGSVSVTIHMYCDADPAPCGGRTRYDAASTIVDATPRSLAGLDDSQDGTLLAGGQLFVPDLDLLIEVVELNGLDGPFQREFSGDLARQQYLLGLTKMPSAKVRVARMSELIARRGETCGNGVRDAGEQCDGGVGCAPDTCMCIAGYEPAFDNGGALGCVARCGNGKVDAEEACDASAGELTAMNCDAQMGQCAGDTANDRFGFDLYYPHYDIVMCGSTREQSTRRSTCGDGQLQAWEQCEPSMDATCDPATCRCPARMTFNLTDVKVEGRFTYVPPPYPGTCAEWMDPGRSGVAWTSSLNAAGSLFRASQVGGTGDGPTALSSSSKIIVVAVAAGAVCCLGALAAVACFVIVGTRSRTSRRRPAHDAAPPSTTAPAGRSRRGSSSRRSLAVKHHS
jgi:hypothetical protein